MNGSRCAAVELLESRRLLSAAVMHHGMLRVAGDAHAQNTISVDHGVDGASMPGIVVTIDSLNARGVSRHFDAFFPDTVAVESIRVIGGSRADIIQVNQANRATPFPTTRVDAGSGSDTISAGGEDDFIRGGNGDDTINAGDGANRVFGERGMDSITTGLGNDRIHGGKDDDTIHAGGGDDLARGDRGADAIFGEDGNDTLFGEKENDTLDGGAGDDILWGGKGDDSETGGDGNDQLGGIIGSNALAGGPGSDTFVVVTLDQQSSNDFNSNDPELDVLRLVSPKADDGNHPPAV